MEDLVPWGQVGVCDSLRRVEKDVVEVRTSSNRVR